MGSISQEPPRLFQWTVCSYRKPGMSEEDYHRYMTEKHAPLVKGLLAQYGILKFSMASTNLHYTSRSRCSTARLIEFLRLIILPIRES